MIWEQDLPLISFRAGLQAHAALLHRSKTSGVLATLRIGTYSIPLPCVLETFLRPSLIIETRVSRKALAVYKY